VFRRGSTHGLITSIPTGGQTAPICGAGAKAALKKAQKNARNSLISETMKRTLPKRRPV
jgi:hypothetical protein